MGGETAEKTLRCLAPFGCMVNYDNASNQPASLPLSGSRENRSVTGFSLPATFPKWDNQKAVADIMGQMLVGKLRLIVDQVLPMSQGAKGHTPLSNRGAMGKVLLVP